MVTLLVYYVQRYHNSWVFIRALLSDHKRSHLDPLLTTQFEWGSIGHLDNELSMLWEKKKLLTLNRLMTSSSISSIADRQAACINICS